MPLVDLKTDLKSLKYGLDRRGLGSSKEPFITKTIPEGETPGATRDFLLRQGAITSGLEDVSRLTKLFSTTRGLSFIGTSELLAAQNPRYPGTPNNLYLPTNTLAQAPLVAVGGHLNYLGGNPFNNDGKYFEVYKRDYSSIDSNRLTILLNKKIGNPRDNLNIGDAGSVGGLLSNLSNVTSFLSSPSSFFEVNTISATSQGISLFDSQKLLNYLGGPNAGKNGLKTNIRRTEFTVGSVSSPFNNIQSVLNKSNTVVSNSLTSLNLNNFLGASKKFNISRLDLGISLEGGYVGFSAPEANPKILNPEVGKEPKKPTITYSAGSNISVDKFNKQTTKTLNTSNLQESPDLESEQLIKFNLNLINADDPGQNQYLFFQAYIDSFSDQVGAEYDPYNYVGRGYPLYKYKGFSRSIGLSFTIVAQTPNQLLHIYKKLNQLQQHLAPNYSNNGYLRGNFVKLTFGDYLNNVPGILKGFSLTPIFEAGFDIGGDLNSGLTSGLQLPKAVKIDGFDFIPIADNNGSIIRSSNSTTEGSDFIYNNDGFDNLITNLSANRLDIDPNIGLEDLNSFSENIT